MQGKSMVSVLTGDSDSVHDDDEYVGWELYGKRAIRHGDWKIVYLPSHEYRESMIPPVALLDTWQLYNLSNDPAEMQDLASTNPEKLAELKEYWEEYAAENNVILPDWTSGY